MKCEIIIDAECEERVVVYAKKDNSLINQIKQLARQWGTELIGYKDKEIVRLNASDIYCVAIIDNKIYAICEDERLQLKERLYVTEEKPPEFFIKINQSCIVNANKIERFDTSVSGTLKVSLKNGYTDYVSRRQLKTIKERIGI